MRRAGKGFGFHKTWSCGGPNASEIGVREQALAKRVLVVAVAGRWVTSAALDAIRHRAAAGPATFHLVFPNPAEHAELTERARRQSRARGEDMLRRALSLLSGAVGVVVEGSVSRRHDPMDAIAEALFAARVDEIILATTRHRLTERLHLDLPRRVEHFGLPVTTVTGRESSVHRERKEVLTA